MPTAALIPVIDFGRSYGLWLLRNNSSWIQLHPLTAEDTVLADRDGDGTDEIVVDFGAQDGLWQYANHGTWTQLHALSPGVIAAGRFQ